MEILNSYRGKKWICGESYVCFLRFDGHGNPIFEHTFMMGGAKRYFQWYYSFGFWFETDSTTFYMTDGPSISPLDPFPDIYFGEWGSHPLVVHLARCLDGCFNSMREKKEFVKKGTEQNYKEFLLNFILCIKYTRLKVPIEMIFLILTYMRIIDVELKSTYTIDIE